MSFLNITVELEKALAELVHSSLLAKGIDSLNHVNTVVKAITDAKQNSVVKAAEVVAETLMPEAAPIIESVEAIAESLEK